MKIKNPLIYGLMLFCWLGFNPLYAQLIKDVNISSEKASFQLIAPNSYLMEIGGPDNYYFRQELGYTNQISLSNVQANGEKFNDGSYIIQITPIVELTDEERVQLRALRDRGDQDALLAYRLEHNLPHEVNVYNISFSIRDGQFVSPDHKEFKDLRSPAMSDQWHQNHPALYASIENIAVSYGKPLTGNTLGYATDNTAVSADDQVFNDDVIINGGSLCVGFDCANGENFGSDTQRLKENNLRLHFDDTSNSASFPQNDWRLVANDQTNGGANYFAIEDATAGRIPFRIEAGAPANALYVDSNGDVGVGTSTPVVETHIKDGDSPTIRLEQDGSSGFSSQTWDVVGNETNFFIRDVTNGSLLPFRIRPGAPKNSFYIDAQGDIGLGTENPGGNALQVESGDVYVKSGKLAVNTAPSAFDFEVVGNSQFSGNVIFKDGDPSFFLTNGISFLNSSFLNVMRIDAANRRVGIATNGPPSYELEVCGTIATTAANVTTGISCSSDTRFKENVRPLSGALNKLVQMRGVEFDWKVNEFPEKGFTADRQIGFIAQEVEALFPELVKADAQGYKLVDYSKLTPVLVEAVKEQQTIIDAQQKEIAQLRSEMAEMQELKAQVAALAEVVSSLSETASSSEGLETEENGDKE